jgi:hypothetical protein
MSNEERVTFILNHVNLKLSKHPEFEEWMMFDGADILPNGNIIPRFVTEDGEAGMSEPKLPVYEQVWKETVLELEL